MIHRSLVAILLSLLGITILIRINATIAHVYEMSGEKTRAVFSLIELSFFYKYYIGVFGLLAFIISIIAHLKGEKKDWVLTAVILSLTALLLTFLKVWKVLV